ncbi:hypothetical protein [Prosthecobacter sp.]
MTAENTLPLSTTRLRYVLMPWIALAVVHAFWMCIDWRMRVPGFPQQGGISEGATTVFQIGSLVAFAAAAYLLAPFMGVVTRILFTIAELIVAIGLLGYAWVHYIVGNGIDTL